MKYIWKDNVSGKLLTIERKVVNYKEGPTLKEFIKQTNLSEQDYLKAEFTRLISSIGTTITFGQKGKW